MVCKIVSLRFLLLSISLIIVLGIQTNVTAQIADATVDDLIAQLRDSDLNRKRDAAYELVRRQLDSEEVVRAFAEAVSDDDSQVRFQALLGLARVASSAGPAIPELIECLDHRDDQVRFRAADALGKIGSPALQPLLNAWDEGSERIQIAAAQAIAEMGPAAESAKERLVDALDDASENLARNIADALVAITPGDQDQLLRLTRHPVGSVRRIGIVALADIRDPSEDVTSALIEAVEDSEPLNRESAIIALAKADLSSAEKADHIETALLDPSPAVRAAANVAMRKANLINAQFATRMASRLPNTDAETINAVIVALEHIGNEAAKTFPALLDVLPTTSSPRQAGIDETQLVSTIASFGEATVSDLLSAIETRPELEPLLSRSLAAIGRPALPTLINGMNSESELIRLASTRALGAMDGLDDDVVARLAQATKDESPNVRAIAVAASIRRGGDNPEVKASLLTATKDPNAVVRSAAIPALSQLTYAQDEMDSALRSALADENETVRASGLRTLAQLPTVQKSFSEEVLALSRDQAPSVREAAAVSISTFKQDQQSDAVTDAIVRLLQDDQLAVKIRATEAVEELKLVDDRIFQAITSNLQDKSDEELILVGLQVAKSLKDGAALLGSAVVELLRHEQTNVRIAAVEALSAVEKDADKKTDSLTVMLDDPNFEVRKVAGGQLGQLGPAAKAAVPKLFELLRSDEDSDFASGALREIDAAPVEALELLIANIDSEERRIGFYAITLLGKIGPPAKAALPKLEAKLEDSGRSGRGDRSDFRGRFLREAIEKIKGE